MLRQPAVALLLGLLSWSSQAATLEFRPDGDYVWTGSLVNIDVVANLDSDERVGAYSLAITWDPAWHEFAGIAFDSFLNGPANSTQVYDDGIGALVVTETASGPLAAQEGQDEIRLLRFTLLAAAIGTSTLHFGSATLLDAAGEPLPVTALDGSLTSVPGPATGLLLASGLGLAGLRARRRMAAG